MALIATVLTLFTFTVLWFLEQKVKLLKKAQAEKEMSDEDLDEDDNLL
jgi:hypothetical protein